MSKYEIVQGSVYQGTQYFRVISLETGMESNLYTYDQCVEIVRLGNAGELRGTFW